MRNDWILDVLTDLQVFADENGMSQTAQKLSEAGVMFISETKQDAPALRSEGRRHNDEHEHRHARGVYQFYPAR